MGKKWSTPPTIFMNWSSTPWDTLVASRHVTSPDTTWLWPSRPQNPRKKCGQVTARPTLPEQHGENHGIWTQVNHNISLAWNKAILGSFTLLTIIYGFRSQWGRHNSPTWTWQFHIAKPSSVPFFSEKRPNIRHPWQPKPPVSPRGNQGQVRQHSAEEEHQKTWNDTCDASDMVR